MVHLIAHLIKTTLACNSETTGENPNYVCKYVPYFSLLINRTVT